MKKLTILLLSIAASMLFTITAFAGTWNQDSTGWWWDNGDGTWPANCWQWCDGNNDGISECYYFNENGYCLQNCMTPDGYQVNADGAWIDKDGVKTQGQAAKAAEAAAAVFLKPGTYAENSQISTKRRVVTQCDAGAMVVQANGAVITATATGNGNYQASGSDYVYTFRPVADNYFIELITEKWTFKMFRTDYIRVK